MYWLIRLFDFEQEMACRYDEGDDRASTYYFSSYEKAKLYFDYLLKEAKEEHEVTLKTYENGECDFKTNDYNYYGYYLQKAYEIPEGYVLDSLQCSVEIPDYDEGNDSYTLYELCEPPTREELKDYIDYLLGGCNSED